MRVTLFFTQRAHQSNQSWWVLYYRNKSWKK